MSGAESFVDKHFKNASRTRLIAYAAACLTVLVVIILWVTLSGSSEEEEKYRGRDAIRESPLVDGSGGFSWQIHTRFKDKLTGLNLEKVVKDAQNYALQSNLTDLSEGFVSAQVWEITDSCDSKNALLSGMLQQDLIDRIINSYPQRLIFGLSSGDILNAFEGKRTAIFSSINGGHMMADKLAVLRVYYGEGVRIFTLNKNECVGKNQKFSVIPDPNDKTKFTISKFLETVINELNRLGIIIDLSGSDTNTQREILKIVKAPVIFSHSVTSLSAAQPASPLIVPDDIMLQLKTNNGLLMLNLGAEHLATEGTKPPDMTTIIKHLNYVRDKFGADYIAIGAGFDSSEQSKPVLKSPGQYPDLFDKLAEGIENAQPWSESDLKKLAGQNFQRVFKEVEKFRDNSADVKPFDYEEEEQQKNDEDKKKEDDKPKP